MKGALALTLALLMIVSVLPVSVFAASGNVADIGNVGFTITSNDESTLAPGVTLNEVVVFDSEGRRVEIFVTTVDTTVDTVAIYANYKDNQNAELGMQTVRDQAAAMEANYEKPFQVVAAINASYYNIETGKPTGAFVMEGVDITTEAEGNAYPFFAVLDDGTYMIGAKGEYSTYKSQIKEAIGGWTHLVKDGAICSGLDSTTLYPRQTIGITADGKVITMTADGQNEPTSYGITVQKQAEIMLAMGCVEALHLDGGSSATFLAKREGSDSLDCLNTPSAGNERAVSNSLMIVSTAVADGTFDHAVLSAKNEYVTPGSTVAVSAVGVDAAGGAAEVPETVTYQMVDSTYGSVTADGVFTSNGTVGDAVIQMVYDGNVVGETTIHVVIPEIAFAQETIVVPYGKSITLSVTATYGAYNVALKDGDVTYVLSDSGIGSVNGAVFTAAAEGAAVTSATVTATLSCDNTVTATTNLSLGKGSEVVQDYEGYEVGKQIYAYMQAHGCGAGDSFVEVVDASTGKVRNGKNALAIHVDGTEYIRYNGFSQNRIHDLNIDNLPAEATALGMWVYIPEEAQGLVMAVRFFKSGTNNTANKTTLYFINGGQPSTMELPGWRYFTVDLSTISFDFDLYSFELFMYEEITNDYGTDLTQEYNNLGKFTLYIDDITLDYSQAVDDREVPEFEDVYLSTSTDGVLMNGQTINYNSFSAYVQASDYAASNAVGLDLTSAKAYVDGVDVTDRLIVGSNGLLTINETVYSEGAHTFMFEIADKNGNVSTIQRHVVVDAVENEGAAITIVPNNPAATKLPVGSAYWIDVKAAEIENVQKVVTTIELDGIHDWMLDFMKVADGFTVTYDLDESTNDITLTITKTAHVDATGEGVLVSLPIHTWEYEQYYNKATAVEPGSIDFSMQNIWARAVEFRADYGTVTFVDGTTDTFAVAPVVTSTEVDLEVNAAGGSTEGTVTNGYHVHQAEAVADKAATCTENGYTGRTICVGCLCNTPRHFTGTTCEGCGSPVEWGTVIPATGHTYVFVDGVLQCKDCDKEFNGAYSDGKEYVDGVAVAGWVGEFYYADGVKLTGVQKVGAPDGSGEFYYDFGETGVCANQTKYTGLFYDASEEAYRYTLAGVLNGGWQLIGEDWYYFNTTTMTAVSGTAEIGVITYEFEENGKLVSGVWAPTLFGMRYYYGPNYYWAGWQTIDGADYFFEKGVRLEDGYQQVLDAGSERIWYYFNEDGSCDKTAQVPDGFYTDRNGYGYCKDGKGFAGLQMIDGTYYYFNYNGYAISGTHAGRLFGNDYKAYTGILEKNDTLYYYNNGVTGGCGLVEVDGDYYYSYWGGVIKTGTHYISTSFCDLPAGEYTFGEDGKALNGIVEVDGVLYYYVNGKLGSYGLFEMDGSYYGCDWDGKVLTGKRYVGTSYCDLPAGEYEFGADGKLLNGVVEKDGVMYLYVNGKTAGYGLFEVDGAYYYSYWGGVIRTGKQYVGTSFCDLPAGEYIFGEDGKMLNGIVEKDGVLYLYQNGITATYGLFEVDGAYYYSYWGGVIRTGKQYVGTSFCDLPAGEYIFGEDGKMLSGIVEKDGVLYLYQNGITATYGLFEIDGAYYYSYWGGVIRTGKQYVGTSFCDLPAGEYEFGADGKMLDGIVEKDGVLYLYQNGRTAACGLHEVDGAYYYAYWGGVIKTGTQYVSTSFCDLPAGEYQFGADGKMLNGFVTKDDGIYWYVNGKTAAPGLIEVDGEYYFVNWGGKLITSQTYYVWETNGYTIKMNYTFDATGKVVG